MASYLGVFYVMDWDGDGFEDILAPQLASASWHLWRSTGESLSPAVNTGVPFSSSSAVAAITDVNGDGQRDLAFTSYPSNALSYRLHAGVEPDLLLSRRPTASATTGPSVTPRSPARATRRGAARPRVSYAGPLQVVTNLQRSDGPRRLVLAAQLLLRGRAARPAGAGVVRAFIPCLGR